MQFSRIAAALSSVVLLSAPVATDALTLGRGAAQRAATGSPVERVVVLLKDMQEKLAIDEKEEQKIYDKYACWCEKTTAHKADAITDATTDLRAFGQTILSLKGNVATLAAEIQGLESDMRQNGEEQAQATSIRQKENIAFATDSTELKEAISAMEKAVTVLGQGSSSLLQASARDKVAAVVNALPASKALKPRQLALLSEYMRSGYAPQSMTVQGILKDMYETFASDLESSTQAEATANANFEDFIATKTEEAQAESKEKMEKEGTKAESEQRLADTQAMYDDTAEQKKADIAFFDETTAACQAKHAAWTNRSALREEEMSGIAKALVILTSDAARALFASAIKAGKETGMPEGAGVPSFLQESSSAQAAASRAAKAYAALKHAVGASHSLRLARLAAKVKLAQAGHFDKVLASIDGMIATLRGENEADIAKRDQCKEEYAKIATNVAELSWLIEKNEAKIGKLTELIELRNSQLDKTFGEIQDVQQHINDITAERIAENEAFLKAKGDDEKAIELLTSAKNKFTAFYTKNEINMGPIQGSVKGVFAQEDPEFAISEDQAPDAEFSDKGARKGQSKGIVSILTMIVEDLGDEIKNGVKAEAEAHASWEQQMAVATKLEEELFAKKVSLEEAIAKRTGEKSAELEAKSANEGDLDNEHKYKTSITPDCDWIIGAFENRAAARSTEMSGLSGARDFLAGAQP